MIDTLPACAISAPESDHCSHTEGRAGGVEPMFETGESAMLNQTWLPLAALGDDQGRFLVLVCLAASSQAWQARQEW